MSRKPSDTELLKSFRNGCTGSYEELIQRYNSKVFSLAYRLTRNADDAEEVLQDVFVTVYRKIAGFEGKASFSSWIYRVTVNAALMKLRKRRQNRSVGIEDILPDYRNSALLKGAQTQEADNLLERAQLSEALEEAIAKLPDEYRPVFVLRDVDGLTSKEVGKILELTIPAVKSRLHRSRLMLRRRLLQFYREYRLGKERLMPIPSVGNL